MPNEFFYATSFQLNCLILIFCSIHLLIILKGHNQLFLQIEMVFHIYIFVKF